jgi:pimeloyl-ACP methyl ester carboxylesterase
MATTIEWALLLHGDERSGEMRRRVLTLAVSATLAAAAILTGTIASAAPTSGFNDPDCRPSSAHPNPVVLLHGMTANANGNWGYHAPRLADAGYCVFAPNYGVQAGMGGTAPIQDSAREIAAYIDQVLATTGAAKVDLAGHSEGGFLSLYIPKMLPYAGKIGKVVPLGPPTHDTTGNLVRNLVPGQIMPPASGDAWAELANGPIAQPGIAYTIIATKNETFVLPPEAAFVREPGVRNIFVQDVCPLDLVGHVALAWDPVVTQLMLNALNPATAKPVQCGTSGLPF